MAREEKMVYCEGLNKDGVPCLLKDGCARFKSSVDKTREHYMAWAPFKEKLGKLICTYKIFSDGGEHQP